MATKKKEEEAAVDKAAAEKADPEKKSSKVKTVELKDKDTGFYDPVTGFQIVRSQKKKLEGEIGTATNVALQSGRLLVVED